jgi:hypothetical protein
MADQNNNLRATARPLSNQAQRLIAEGLSPTTRRTYASGLASFTQFCNVRNIHVTERFPASELVLIEFVAYLATERRLLPGSIHTYLLAIRAWHIDNGEGDPLLGKLTLRRALRGADRLYGRPRRLRHPITADILRAILSFTFAGEWEEALFRAAILLGFFGFLRAGEFTLKTAVFDPERNPVIGDISFIGEANVTHGLTFRIKVSKTDPFRMGSMVHIGVTSNPICPVLAMVNYIRIRRGNSQQLSPTQPLFTHRDGSPLRYQQLVEYLNSRLLAAGIPTNGFSGHSLRIGAATTAAAAGVPDWMIKCLGRWRSDCYQQYIHTPTSAILAVAPTLVSRSVGVTNDPFRPPQQA